MRFSVGFPKLIALFGLIAGVFPSLAAQNDLPPEFLRSHALVVRFFASSFVSTTPGLPEGQGQAPNAPPPAGQPAPGTPSALPPPQGAPAGAPAGTSASTGSPVPGALGAPPSQGSPPSQRQGSDAGAVKPQGAVSLAIPSWSTKVQRYTVTGAPVAIRLSGEGIVIVVQVTPYDKGKQGLLVVAQGQVWLRGADGRIMYHSAFESLNVAFGEPLYFFPLGLNPDGSTSLKVEIAIDRFGNSPSVPEGKTSGQDATGKQDK
ncbi:MAG TPA: hypothetical protein VMV44_06735 [Rectinemataceae bacterium]|nr:hypothetical protein [Rectinemataceae bacterium]